MKDILFYLLLGVLFYYILSRFLENYSLEQENFDPSLVPVSSIVTLAKVAQKLVTGGVLTNPGSLQIGTPNAGGGGNLLVTGNNTVNGNNTVLGNTTLANVKINPVGTTGNTIIQYGDGTGKKVVFQKDDANPQLEIFDNKKVNIKGELNVDGIFNGNNISSTTNSSKFGQTTINGGKITIGNTDNYVEKLLTNVGTNLIIQGKDGGALETSTSNLLKWNNTGVTAENLKVNGTFTTPSIRETINTPSGGNVSINNLEITGSSSGHTFYITGTYTSSTSNKEAQTALTYNKLLNGQKYLAVAQIKAKRPGSGWEGWKFYFDKAEEDTDMPYYMGVRDGDVEIGGSGDSTVGYDGGYPFPRTSAYGVITGPTVDLKLTHNSDDAIKFKILIILTQINKLTP